MENNEFNAVEFAKKKKEEFLKAVFENKLDDLTVVLDITQGQKGYTALSKHDQSSNTYPLEGMLQKLKTIYSQLNNGYSVSFDKNDIRSITDNIPNVDGIFTDLAKKPGLVRKSGFTHYNHWNRSQMMNDVDSFNAGRAASEYKDFRFDSLPHINFLIDHLLNVEENKAYNSDKKEVDLKEHFINWLASCLQQNEKTGMYYLFVSPTQGTGKSLFCDIIKTYYSLDYYSEANNDTFLSTHNKLIDNKLFICLNEIAIDSRDYDKFNSKIKVLITEQDVIIRAMYKDQVVQKSYSNSIVNSNKIIPYQIEAADRRATVVRSATDELKKAVKDNLKMDIQDFVEAVKQETFIFLCELLNLKTDRKRATYNALMTEAKKIIIRATNTQAMNVMSLMEKNDESGLRDYFSECDNDHLLEDFLLQVDARFLTNDMVNNFLHVNLREDMGAGSKMSKKIFWDRRLGAAVNVPYTNKEGKKTSTSVRKLAGFKTVNVQSYFAPFDQNGEFYEEVAKKESFDDSDFFDLEDGI